MINPARRCGRCNVDIADGLFCLGCRASLSCLGLSPENRSAGVSFPAPPIRIAPSRHRSSHGAGAPRPAAQHWCDLILVDQSFTIDLRTNDPKLAVPLLSNPVFGCDFVHPAAGNYQYSVEAQTGDAGTRYIVRTGGRRLGVVHTRDEALNILQDDWYRNFARDYTDRVLIHATVVSWKGRALALPGPASVDKTRLVIELLRRGALYVSDAYVMLDSSGIVHAFSRRPYVGPVNPEYPGAASASDPLPLGLVLFTKYVPGVAWRSQRLMPDQAFLALWRNAVPVRTHRVAAIRSLRQAAVVAPVYETDCSGARRSAARVLALFEDSSDGRKSGAAPCTSSRFC